jgi:hypothetical protein
VLGDGDKRRLVVGRGVDGRDLVDTSGETLGDVLRDDAVAVGGAVQALEVREGLRVGGRGLVDLVKVLDDDVRVADDYALSVHLLGRGEVVLLGVDERAWRNGQTGKVGDDREGQYRSGGWRTSLGR